MKHKIQNATILIAVISVTAMSTIAFAAGKQPSIPAQLNPVDAVDPFIGTGAHGHTYPGATVPFGMVQVSPDTRTDTWDGCSGYHWSDSSILGFSHTHLSGTGCGDLGDILFIPTTTAIDLNSDFDYKKYRTSFQHSDETAHPGYYRVKMGNVHAELTATTRAAFHRYTFAGTKTPTIIIDLAHGIHDEPIETEIKIIDDHTVTGLRRSKGWAKNQYVYFAAKFSQPFTGFGTIKINEKPVATARTAQGKRASCWLNFSTSNGTPLMAKVALSSVNVDGALKNLDSEIPSWDFDQTHRQAKSSWEKELNKIQVSTTNKDQAKIFYTSLYHCLLAPTIVSDVDGNFRGSDNAIHKASGFENYSTFSLWDTFRAEHSLLTLIEPNRVDDLINSLLVHGRYHEDKTLPIWSLASNETYCMIGYHSFPVIAEAYLKGFRGWDAEEAFKLMVGNTRRNDWWAETGYIPSGKEPESVSKTLEFAYDDWCLAQFAKALGHTVEAQKFAKRASFFTNVFDKQTGFMRGRSADGTWRTPFDPTQVLGSDPLKDFTEANSWQYSFFVPQNVPAMIQLYGGNTAFVKKLEQMFETLITGQIEQNDVSGLIGQYAQGNEPSHHVAYLYSFADAPSKTAERVSQIRDSMYASSEDGLCGNEDCGQMSAWYVFSALGFYPVNPVDCTYVIGTPLFEESKLKLPAGKTFTILAPGVSNKRIYVQKAILNGKPLKKLILNHKDIVKGGTLILTMADKPGA